MLFDRLRRKRALERAERALAQGHTGETVRIAEDILSGDSDSVAALVLLGRARLVEDDLGQAQAVLERALGLDPADEAVRERLGEVHARRAANAREFGNVDEAVASFGEALALVQDKAFIYYNLGCAYADFHQEHAAEAVEMWQLAIAERPDYIEPHFDLGTALFHSERYDEAAVHFEAVLAERPDWPAPQYLIGVMYAMRGDTAEALQRLKAAVEVNPGWARTAAEDKHLASLRGHPDFEALLEAHALIQVKDVSLNVLTPEEISRDAENEDESGCGGSPDR